MDKSVSPIDRERLLAHVLRKPREWVLAHPDAHLRPAHRRRFASLLRRRAAGEPLAYLLGEQWFYGRPFAVNHSVLIPRPETELMIELALIRIRELTAYSLQLTALDIGTGSGCIAVTLAAEFPRAAVIATDSSSDALRVARANARRHAVASRITFLRGDLLKPLLNKRRSGLLRPDRSVGARNDTTLLVLANLPYLTTSEWRALPRSIRAHEPRAALDGGPDGLAAFRQLLTQLRNAFQISDFRFQMLLEIDPRRKRALVALIRKHLPNWEASWHRDLAGRYRVLSIQYRVYQIQNTKYRIPVTVRP